MFVPSLERRLELADLMRLPCDKASYLKALPQHATRSKFSDIVATGNGATLVVRYKIETEQTIDGHPVNGIAPRLSVFRKAAGRGWLTVAHANFAPIAA